MNWKQHLFLGTVISLSGFLMLYKLKILELHYLLFIPYILFLSLIQDIDHPKSKARKVVYILLVLSIITISFSSLFKFIYILFIIVPIILLFIIESLKHRSITHTIKFGILLSFPLYFIEPFLMLVAFLSFFSHLLFDSMIKF